MNSAPSIGVRYVAFKEVNAVNHSLQLFRRVYPDAPVYLVSDGGSDFSYLESDPNIKFTMGIDTMGYAAAGPSLDKMIADKTFDVELALKIGEPVHFMDRMKDAIEYCKTDYMLLMEPDVIVRSKIKIDSSHHLVGQKPNDIEPEVLNYIRSRGGNESVRHFGPVGGLVRSESFLKVYDLVQSDPQMLRDLLKISPRVKCWDYLIVVLFAIAGFPYEESDQIVECIRNPFWKITSHPVVHQFRDFYNYNYGGKWESI